MISRLSSVAVASGSAFSSTGLHRDRGSARPETSAACVADQGQLSLQLSEHLTQRSNRVTITDNYTSYVEFPAREYSSKVVRSGQRSSFDVGYTNKVETIVLVGISNGGEYFWVANGNLRPNLGGTAHTYGTIYDHWAMTPQF